MTACPIDPDALPFDRDLNRMAFEINLTTGLAVGWPDAEIHLDDFLSALSSDGWTLTDTAEARLSARAAIIGPRDDQTPWVDAVAAALRPYLIAPADGG